MQVHRQRQRESNNLVMDSAWKVVEGKTTDFSYYYVTMMAQKGHCMAGVQV